MCWVVQVKHKGHGGKITYTRHEFKTQEQALKYQAGSKDYSEVFHLRKKKGVTC